MAGSGVREEVPAELPLLEPFEGLKLQRVELLACLGTALTATGDTAAMVERRRASADGNFGKHRGPLCSRLA
eukprot:5909862-Lingulodinium_polyedra.AAC.1